MNCPFCKTSIQNVYLLFKKNVSLNKYFCKLQDNSICENKDVYNELKFKKYVNISMYICSNNKMFNKIFKDVHECEYNLFLSFKEFNPDDFSLNKISCISITEEKNNIYIYEDMIRYCIITNLYPLKMDQGYMNYYNDLYIDNISNILSIAKSKIETHRLLK